MFQPIECQLSLIEHSLCLRRQGGRHIPTATETRAKMLGNHDNTRGRQAHTDVYMTSARSHASAPAADTSAAPAPAPATPPSAPSTPKYAIHAADVEAAKNQIGQIWSMPASSAPFLDRDRDASWGPAVVKDNISLHDFEKWLNVNEGRLRRWCFEPYADGSGNGRVVIYSLSSLLHERSASRIMSSITRKIMTLGNQVNLIRSVETDASPTCRTGDRSQEPDGSLTPVDLTVGPGFPEAGNGCSFPNIIVEIAYKNDSLELLQAKLRRWMNRAYSSVQVAIAIKIFPDSLRRIGILHVRGQPVHQ